VTISWYRRAGAAGGAGLLRVMPDGWRERVRRRALPRPGELRAGRRRGGGLQLPLRARLLRRRARALLRRGRVLTA